MGDGRHPYFPVGKLVPWEDRLAPALAAARASGRSVLLIHGRQTCGGTRALCEKTIAKQEIAEFLNQHFVALASDADHPDPQVAALVAALPRREPTPVVAYLDAAGAAVHSTAGGRPPAVFLSDMTDALGRR
jgi:hypothetical protein